MRLLATFAAAAFALTSSGVTFAQPDPAVVDEAQASDVAAPVEKAAKKEKARKICRNETATGSVMPKRKCYTVEQIKAQQKQTEEDLRNLKK